MSNDTHGPGLSLVIGIALCLLVLTVLHLITLELIVAILVAHKYRDVATFHVMKLYNKNFNFKSKEKPNGY